MYFGYLVSQISTKLLPSHWYIILPCMKELGVRCATTNGAAVLIISQCISEVFICSGQMGEVWKEEGKDRPLLKDFTTEWVNCKLRGCWVLGIACLQLCFPVWVESTI